MGFNTTAFILNDFAGDFERAPKTTAHIFSNPYVYANLEEHEQWRRIAQVAESYGEKPLHPQAVKFICYHADFRRFFTAGGNCISELAFVRTQIDRKTKKRVVVLELPDYLQDRKRF
jgi:hypothetical protein